MGEKKILIVDDEVKIVEILANFLGTNGFGVIKTYDGREALDVLLKREQVDLILLDEKMPIMGGTTLLKEMKKMGMDIPVIVLTGSIGVPHVTNASKELYEHVMIKPIRLSELLERINSVLASGQKAWPGRSSKKKKKP